MISFLQKRKNLFPLFFALFVREKWGGIGNNSFPLTEITILIGLKYEKIAPYHPSIK
jgi:hypothetical protein